MWVERFPTAENWINDHQVEYDRLFDDGALEPTAAETLAALPHLDPESIPLSFLARHNDVRSRLSHEKHRRIHRGVERILGASYGGEFGDEHTFLADLSLDKLRRMEYMTAQLIFAWQRGCNRYRMPSPFEGLYGNIYVPLDDIKRPPVTLVLMGAAALRSAGEYVPHSRAATPRIKKISTYGPKYYRNRKLQFSEETADYPNLDELQD